MIHIYTSVIHLLRLNIMCTVSQIDYFRDFDKIFQDTPILKAIT